MMRPMCTDPDTSSLSITNGTRYLFTAYWVQRTVVPMSLSSPIRFVHVPSQRLLVLAFLTPEASHFPLDEDTPTDSRASSCND
jgi:hypothetical protein